MSAVPVQPPAVGDAVREIEDFGALLQKQLGRDRELRELFWSAEAKHELARCIAENVPCRPFYVKLLLSLIEAAVHWAGGILARNLKEKLFEQAAQVLDAQSPIAGMQRNIVASLRKALADTIVRQRVVTAIRAGKRIDPRTLTADELFNVLSSELTIQLYQLSILEGIRLRLEQLDQPSLLLRARRRPSDQQETSSLANFSFNMNLTGFYGREDEIAFLTDFLADDEQIRWQLVCGPSGSGKRRLAMEFCRDCIDRGWIAGFTSGNLGIQWHTWQPLADTLIVVDQLTAASAKKLKTVLVELHGARGRLKHKVRVLLLAPSPDGLWWSIFFPPTTWEFGLLDDMRWMPPYFLPALSPEDLTTIVKESYRAHLGEDGWLDRNWHSRDRFLQRTGSLQSPLMAMFAGAFLARVSNSKSRQSQAFDRAGFEDLFKAVIDPERERWLSAGASDAFLDELARVTIVGGLSRAQWVSPAVKFDDFAAILGSPKMGSIAALQPELLGEYFVLSQLQQRTVEQVTEFVRQCWAIDSVATRAFFDRALSEFPRHPAVPIIAAVAKPPDGVDKLEWFKFRLDVLKRWPDQSRYFGYGGRFGARWTTERSTLIPSW